MARNFPTQYGKQADSFDGNSAICHLHTRSSCDDSTGGASISDTPPLLPRVGHPEDIANLVALLVSNETSFISGVAIAVDGDLTPHFSTDAE